MSASSNASAACQSRRWRWNRATQIRANARLRGCASSWARRAPAAPLQGLVWIPEQPLDRGRLGEAGHSGVIAAVERNQGAVLLAVVEGDPLFRLRLGRGQLAKIEQDGFQDRVG